MSADLTPPRSTARQPPRAALALPFFQSSRLLADAPSMTNKTTRRPTPAPPTLVLQLTGTMTKVQAALDFLFGARHRIRAGMAPPPRLTDRSARWCRPPGAPALRLPPAGGRRPA
ncbi:MAG: hypothetical protein MZW92_26035 [Comamonadaceae bacterium]|nr:hypothetical protein [Comamonadaceae bacterium]